MEWNIITLTYKHTTITLVIVYKKRLQSFLLQFPFIYQLINMQGTPSVKYNYLLIYIMVISFFIDTY
jgi:hypothetical protein